MKKPVGEIERIKQWNLPFTWQEATTDLKSVVAYLDSIPSDAIPVVWPAELTRERLEFLASNIASWHPPTQDALRALAAIAPQRKKRMVNLWKHKCVDMPEAFPIDYDPRCDNEEHMWRKVGGPVEIDE